MPLGFSTSKEWCVPYRKSIETEKVMLDHLIRVFSPNKKGVVAKWCQRWGRRWYACDRNMWWRKCGLTEQQVRTAEYRLIKHGVIEVEVWLFMAVRMRHYHLHVDRAMTYRALISTPQINAPIIEGQEPKQKQNTQSQYQTSEAVASLKVNKTTTYELESMPKNKVKDSPSPIPSPPSKTAMSVLKEFKAKQNSIPVTPEKATAATLSRYWMSLVPLVMDKALHPPHTMKELGMLTQYAKVTGKYAAPAMEWAIRNWPKFRYRASEQHGMPVPPTPVVWALLKGCSEAVEGYVQWKEGQEAPKTVESPALQISAKAPEPKATKAEIEQALKDMANDED